MPDTAELMNAGLPIVAPHAASSMSTTGRGQLPSVSLRNSSGDSSSNLIRRPKTSPGFFADPAFMTHLDVAFANLYFGAADAAGTPAAVPLAWRPLVEQRAASGIEPVQFALAGMNAHINHDLPVAMVSTCTALATSPDVAPHPADYQKVDLLLDAAEQSIRQSFESAPELAVDRHLSAVANLIANWTVNSARDLAWTNSLLLWAIRDDPIARGLFLDTLAASTALACRMLLVAV